VGFLETLQSALAREGLNHTGVVARARYDAAAPAPLRAERIHPETRAIVVVGSGGRAHWAAFLAYVAEDPVERLGRRADPLDDFCAAVFARLGSLLEGCRVIFPVFGAAVHLDFMKLGELAGLGAPSELGILVSEPFGPWFGLRAAVFAPHDLPEGRAARRLCDGCHAPCRTACPAGIVGQTPFPWPRCGAERSAPGSPCRAQCGAREACIASPEARYDALELAYHHDRATGRRLLCARFGVPDEVGAPGVRDVVRG
jgi:epoxyqueuosine reductase